MIKLNEEGSAVLHNKWPPKLEDTGSFSISYIIENFNFDSVFCDFDASINLMSLSAFKSLVRRAKANNYFAPIGG